MEISFREQQLPFCLICDVVFFSICSPPAPALICAMQLKAELKQEDTSNATRDKS